MRYRVRMTDLIAAGTLVRQLAARPDAFPHATGNIEILETHISWIILTGRYAYKIKKPLDLGFLDFSSAALRQHYCQEELRLNRRFAPDIYLDVVTIGGNPDQPEIGAEPTLEHAVRMVQFPSEARLDHVLGQNLISQEDMSAFGQSVARLHQSAPVAAADSHYGSITAISRPTRQNFSTLRKICTRNTIVQQLNLLSDWIRKETTALHAVFTQRPGEGKVRECHGDLHLENLVMLEGEIVAFDCLEFDARLRWIDVMSEVAFLEMDLLLRGQKELAFAFLNKYLEISGDYQGIRVLPFYLVYRAMVRAKVAAVRHRQSPENTSFQNVSRHLDWAQSITSPGDKPLLIINHGLSGSGKTYLSSQLMNKLPAIRIRSDIIRKRMHGLDEFEQSQSRTGSGIYSKEAGQRLYQELVCMAGISLHSGFNVIIDATCLLEHQRRLFIELSRTADVRLVILCCETTQQILTERIRNRLKNRADASEADLEVLSSQQSNLEPLNQGEEGYALHINTGKPIKPEEIVEQILR